MAEKDEQDTLIRVKAGAEGVDVSLSKAVPGVIARLLPVRFRLRRAVDEEIGNQIIRKIHAGADLDEAELVFADAALGDAAKKFVRLKQIEARARELLALPPLIPPPPQLPEHEAPRTSDDWMNKFREDASLVDDGLVREIYARVLREEEGRPKAFSLRTLGVLRYLDRDAAVAFGQLQKVVFNDAMVPAQVPDPKHVLNAVGASHEAMLSLDDAGLVNSQAQSEWREEGEQVIVALRGHGRVLAARRVDGAPFTVNLPVHLLTPAGKQLAQISEFEPDGAAFDSLVAWYRPFIGEAELFVAPLPARNWTGPVAQLTWTKL